MFIYMNVLYIRHWVVWDDNDSNDYSNDDDWDDDDVNDYDDNNESLRQLNCINHFVDKDTHIIMHVLLLYVLCIFT